MYRAGRMLSLSSLALLAAAFACTVAVGAITSSSSFPLIGVDGVCKPATQISGFLSSASKSDASGLLDPSCCITSVVDLSEVDGDGCSSLVNALLKTSFPAGAKGVCVDVSVEGGSKSVVVLAGYEQMYSNKFCGSKAADFCGAISDTVVLVVSLSELTESLSGHDQALRRIIKAAKERGVGGLKSVLFLVDTTLPAPEAATEEQVVSSFRDISQAVDSIWSDLDDEKVYPRSTQINTLAVNLQDAESVAAAQSALAKLLISERVGGGGEEDASGALASKLFDAWTRVAPGIPRPILSQALRQSVFTIDTAYTTGVAHSEAAFNQWQGRIGSGKIVGKFGDRVAQLLDGVLKRFAAQTSGSQAVRERAMRASQLRQSIRTVATNLFKQQLALLQTQVTNSFKKTLLKQMATTSVADMDEDMVKANKEEEQQALRNALMEFTMLAAELEVEELGMTSTAAQSELSTALQTIATEFPESSIGRLEVVKKMEKQTRKPKKKKGVGKGKAINIGLNLVGMLRPPGYGNLQAFVGYTTSMLGLPLELLLGIQNDGDSPEIMGEDREHPLLRLQPKVHFDVDLGVE